MASSPAEAQHRVRLPVVVGPHPRTVVVHHLERRQQVAAAHAWRRCSEESAPPLPAAGQAHERAVEHVQVVHVRGARRGEIALVREVRPLLELDAAPQLRNEEADVRISMRVRTRRSVYGKSGHGRGEVGAMVKIETAQVVLVRLPPAAVLADDEARHRLEHLTSTHDRPRLELGCGDGALTAGRGDSHEVLGRALDVRDVPERARCGYDDVRAERQRQHRVRHGLARWRHRDGSTQHGEIDQPVRQLRGAGPDALKAKPAVGVGRSHVLLAAPDEVDRHAGQHAAGLIGDASGHVLRDRARSQHEHGDCNKRCYPHRGSECIR